MSMGLLGSSSGGRKATIGKTINLLYQVNKVKVYSLQSQMIRQNYPPHK